MMMRCPLVDEGMVITVVVNETKGLEMVVVRMVVGRVVKVLSTGRNSGTVHGSGVITFMSLLFSGKEMVAIKMPVKGR